MDIEEFKKLVGDHSEADKIVSAYEETTKKGIESYKKAKDDRERYRLGKKALETSLKDYGIDPEGDLQEQIKALSGKEEASSEELADLKRKVSAYELKVKDLESERDGLSETLKKGTESELKATLSSILTANKGKGFKDLVDNEIAKGNVFKDEAGEIVFKDGESVFSVTENSKKYVDLLVNSERLVLGSDQKGGSGGSANGGSGTPNTFQEAPDPESRMQAIKVRLKSNN